VVMICVVIGVGYLVSESEILFHAYVSVLALVTVFYYRENYKNGGGDWNLFFLIGSALATLVFFGRVIYLVWQQRRAEHENTEEQHEPTK